LKQTVNILADIKIGQSDYWRQNTTFIGDLYPGLMLRLNKILRGYYPSTVPFINFLLLIRNFCKFDVIVTSNIRTGLFVAFYKKLFSIRHPKHIVLELMLDEHSQTFVWKIKTMVQKYAFSSINIVFVSARDEVITYCERFDLNRKCVRFLPFHTNIIEPRLIIERDSFVLSAGRSGRDYRTLIEASKVVPMEVVIISDEFSIKGLHISPNIRLYVNIGYTKYLALLKKCNFVVLPLHSLGKSTGQVVMLEAMALGKPVIATNTVGTKDYILDGVNGLLVPPYDVGAMENAIKILLNNKSLCDRLAVAALDDVRKYHSFDYYVSNIISVAKEINSC
jgi:glycosyltransferase involved in cell wall biosynthesis